MREIENTHEEKMAEIEKGDTETVDTTSFLA
jgi:hypothetical protein